MIVAAIDWNTILLALIAVVPSTIAAIYAGRVHSAVKTPSGTSIGKQVENALHTSLANHYRLRALSGEPVEPPSPAAQAREADAAAANGET